MIYYYIVYATLSTGRHWNVHWYDLSWFRAEDCLFIFFQRQWLFTARGVIFYLSFLVLCFINKQIYCFLWYLFLRLEFKMYFLRRKRSNNKTGYRLQNKLLKLLLHPITVQFSTPLSLSSGHFHWHNKISVHTFPSPAAEILNWVN